MRPAGSTSTHLHDLPSSLARTLPSPISCNSAFLACGGGLKQRRFCFLELGSGYYSAVLVTTNEDEAVVALLERRGTALALMLCVVILL
jgi:hypothetical protein